MDPRIREHASLLVHEALELEEGDDVIVRVPDVAEDLLVAIYEALGDVGANPVSVSGSARAHRAYMRSHDGEFELPDHEMALVEAADAHIHVRADENVTETSDVAPERNAAYQQARRPILDERLTDNWTLTQYPAPANAQLAEMSTEGYENFVWDAVNKDWDAQEEFQAQMVEILDGAEEVRIVSGDTTDVRMRVADNPTINDTCKHNVPGGEVFTAPQPDSVEGEVLFDKPVYQQGREVLDAHLHFENGEVVEHSASKNEDVLTEILDTDDGARRLGELGIGMNRDIDQFTYNMLFDEKMGDTVHMAVGRAYEDTVGEGNEQNESAVHVDMIVDMSEDSRIEVDGEVVQRNGTFRFEDGFEE
ncbi:aminopeptidase [Natronoarchaeum philippinense]|uniref:Aminopeptidase n=1 Tax=Natronoarchaeum philippinense TaxID=558529 RepID=A0A285P2T5_NATPI|nr:aminopeptidase [Natronoarchaeum philippinense]SNZ16042.1 aminopeptidase [Natronoarchaeum philippinense]